MTLITPTILRDTLRLQGIESDLDDDTLSDLIELKVNEITALTGLPIHEVNRKQIVRRFTGDLFELDYYPVTEITSFKIDDNTISCDDIILDEAAGIIYFKQNHEGLLVIEYVQKASDNLIKSTVNSLIGDMILYQLKYPEADSGAISSIHEAEQSISYDTTNNLGNRIYARINTLKTSYSSCRVKWL